MQIKTALLVTQPKVSILALKTADGELRHYGCGNLDRHSGIRPLHANVLLLLLDSLEKSSAKVQSTFVHEITTCEYTFADPIGICLLGGHICDQSYWQDELRLPACSDCLNRQLSFGLATWYGLLFPGKE